MPKFTITADGDSPYILEAPSAFDAWEKAFKNHPRAGRVEVTREGEIPRPRPPRTAHAWHTPVTNRKERTT